MHLLDAFCRFLEDSQDLLLIYRFILFGCLSQHVVDCPLSQLHQNIRLQKPIPFKVVIAVKANYMITSSQLLHDFHLMVIVLLLFLSLTYQLLQSIFLATVTVLH